MDDIDDDQPLRPRQVVRLLLPVFAVSTLVMLVGVILVVTRHRTSGLFLVIVGTAGGFAIRTRLMIRSQRR